MVHQKKPQRMLRLFCCTIPFGTDSHFAQALVFVSRGLVAKFSPQDLILNAPTDGAPKNALHDSVGRFLLIYFKKARSGAPSEILEQGGGTQCRKERHKGDSSKCSGTVKTVPYG